MALELLLSNVEDQVVRENLQRIQDYLKLEAKLEGFAHVDISVSGAVTGHKVSHGLGFVPKDVITTYQSGAGALTWNYSQFDKNFLNLTTTGPVRVRAFVGSYKGS